MSLAAPRLRREGVPLPEHSVHTDAEAIKARLRLNSELARSEDFVPPVVGSEDRQVFVETVGRVRFYHYDPYAQLLSKVVRRFARDMEDTRDAKRVRAAVNRL